jgi:sulfide dehydrogenase [flavocytochrome c] flavoprotein subunit
MGTAGAAGGKVVKFDAKTNTASSDFNDYKGDVVNIIPPHHAGAIAKNAGLTNEKGWCPVDMLTMESSKARRTSTWSATPACMANCRCMPRRSRRTRQRRRPRWRPARSSPSSTACRIRNRSSSTPATASPQVDWGFSVVHIYRVKDGKLVYIKEAGGISPVNMDRRGALKLQRKLESEYATGWLKNIMADAFS